MAWDIGKNIFFIFICVIFKLTKNNCISIAPKPRLNQRVIPNQMDVLAHLLFYKLKQGKSLSDACNLVAVEVTEIWKNQRKRVKYLKERRSIVRSLNRLHDEYYVLKKNSNRSTATEIEKRRNFMFKLVSEFDIESENIEQKTKTDATNEAESLISIPSTSSFIPNTPDPDYQPAKRTKRLNSFAISQDLVGALDRAKISNRRASNIILTSASAMGVNLDDVNASYSTFQRQRSRLRERMASEIRDKFLKNNANKRFIIHWDSTLLYNFTDENDVNAKVHRLAIILSNGDEMKLLSIPKIAGGSGKDQFDSVKSNIENWNVKTRIIGMCFDTTSVNTGQNVGTCVLLRSYFDDQLVEFACRHHVHELILKNAFKQSVEKTTTGPTVAMFDRFKSSWNTIQKSIIEPGINNNLIDSSFPSREKHELIEFFNKHLRIQHSRDDHVELLQLAIMFLGSNERFTIRKPGATSRARFMAHAIYALKIYLYRGQFKLTCKLKQF